jgi:uncharacterized membrane protein YhaH (DUF805 family)
MTNLANAFFNFKGRMNRLPYLGCSVVLLLINMIVMAGAIHINPMVEIINLFLIYPAIAITIKRFHDLTYPAWAVVLISVVSIILSFALYAFSPALMYINGLSVTASYLLVYLLVAVVFLMFGVWLVYVSYFKRGTVGKNEYGADPLNGKHATKNGAVLFFDSFFDLKGKMNRIDFWLYNVILFAILFVLDMSVNFTGFMYLKVIYILISLISVYSLYALNVKRFHDMGLKAYYPTAYLLVGYLLLILLENYPSRILNIFICVYFGIYLVLAFLKKGKTERVVAKKEKAAEVSVKKTVKAKKPVAGKSAPKKAVVKKVVKKVVAKKPVAKKVAAKKKVSAKRK